MVGPFSRAANNYPFFIVAIDYFSKWVEAGPIITIIEHKTFQFIWKNIICNYGMPNTLISDNIIQFKNASLEKYCERVEIKQFFFSHGRPQENGQTEVTNRTILYGIKKRLEEAKGRWTEEVYAVLWSYKTIIRTLTGVTPIILAHGSEVVFLKKVGLPTHIVQTYDPKRNVEEIRLDVDLIEERREDVEIKQVAYQQRTVRFYNQRIKSRPIAVGDLVLKKTLQKVNKLHPNWHGPYKIVDEVVPGTYRLENLEGELFSNP